MNRAVLVAIAASIGAAGIVSAAPVSSPQLFMESVYSKFKSHGEPDYHFKAADAIFTPELAALEHKHQAQVDAGQDDPDDGNDLCDGCQETTAPNWKITTIQQGLNKAISTVLFMDGGRTTHYRFWLRLTNSGWRIDDFQDTGAASSSKPSPSFKAQLIASIKRASARKKGSH